MRRCRPAAAAVLPVLLPLLAPACSEAPDPLAHRLEAIPDEEANRAVVAMIEAYGGYAGFQAHRNVEYTYTLRLYGPKGTQEAMLHQVHRFGLGPRPQGYVEDLEGETAQIIRLDGEDLLVTRGGTRLADPAALAFPRAYVGMARWTFLNPWNLLEPGLRLEPRGVRTPKAAGVVPAGTCDVLRVRFDHPGDVGGTDDWHDFYIGRLTRLVEQVHTYRAQENTYRLAIWSDHRSFDGVRVATRREVHASDETGAIGRLEAVAEYSDVRFDAPFGEEIFRDEALAAAGGRP